ncbi:hypothetical protein THRCLA_20621 [Thraustotheca clavata]|uniref:PX domain-containing protein n=1 Tax=Thraustotheca clavata TaxID=74557 RepID=A0A1W0A5X8_9STRA|nr:hypothetical protein THRCLA_20621 [Thraustotheca clavata]
MPGYLSPHTASGSQVFTNLSASIVSLTKEPNQRYYTFGILLDNGIERWVLYKRYSDFRRFRQTLLKMTRRPGCDCQYLHLPMSTVAFPGRSAVILPWQTAERIAIKRQDRLTQFLTVMLSLMQTRSASTCNNELCPILNLVQRFLQVIPMQPDRHWLRDMPPQVPWKTPSPSRKPPVYPIRENEQVVNSPASSSWFSRPSHH